MKRKQITWLTAIAFFGIGFFSGGKMLVSMINENKMKIERNFSNMLVMNDWLDFIYSGGNVRDYFHKLGYCKVMIYGGSYIGARLSQALEGSDIKVVAIMDKTVSSDENGTVIGTDAEIPDVDCIVITPVFYYDEIFDMLRKKTDIPIVSIQTVIEKGDM